MNIFLHKKIWFFICIFFFGLQISLAQDSTQTQTDQTQASQIQNTDSTNCPYIFSKNLSSGMTDPDVLVLQKLLNTDKRTTIAVSGVGSPGNETNYFGAATKTALKRFQALFIEYIGVADGNFNDRTRQVAQYVICNANSQTNTNTTPTVNTNTTTQNSSTKTNTQNNLPGPTIILSSNLNSVPAGTTFKVILDTNKEIQTPTSDAFILDGATVKDIRKLGKLQYEAIVVPNDGADKLDLQVEADKITALDGSQNDEASNQIILSVTGGTNTTNSTANTTAQNSGSIFDTLNSILTQMTSQQPTTKYCYGVQILATQDCSQTTQAQAVQQQQAQQQGAQTQASTQAQISSPFQSAQTPYYNSSTGQYQNTPPSQSQSLFGSLSSMLGGLFGGGKGAGAGAGSGSGSGSGAGNSGSGAVSGPSTPSQPSALDLANAEVKKSCTSGKENDVECIVAQASQVSEQAKADAAGKSCGALESNTSFRQKVQAFGIQIKQNSASYDQMPGKVILLLKKLKDDCKCSITLTAGTETAGHVSHGPKKAIFDIRSIGEGAAFTSYINSKGRNINGAVFNYEGSGANANTTAPHWHVNANGYQGQCSGGSTGPDNKEESDVDLE